MTTQIIQQLKHGALYNYLEEGRAEWSVSSMKSSTVVVNMFLQKINQKSSTKLSGPCLFGFDLELLYHAHLQIGSQPVTTIKNNKYKEIDDQFSIDSSEYTSDILVDNSEIGNGAFYFLLAILKVLIPVWKMGKNP
ncbi:31163_t:CDS:2, partial [Gigaspora margarita]